MNNFTVIGPGRAGRSFAAALTARGWHLVAQLGRAGQMAAAAHDADIVFLTVPDDQIAATARRVEPGPAVVLHTSGVKGLDVLAPHERTGSVHPLVSMPDADIGARRLTDDAVFAVDGDPAADEVVAALGGRPVRVPDDRRALYHATASVAANHLVVLCAQVERLAAEVGVPIDAYWGLMAATLDNVRAAGALSSLTGPAARGDRQTLRLHVDALPPREHELYTTLSREAAGLADRPVPEEWVRRP